MSSLNSSNQNHETESSYSLHSTPAIVASPSRNRQNPVDRAKSLRLFNDFISFDRQNRDSGTASLSELVSFGSFSRIQKRNNPSMYCRTSDPSELYRRGAAYQQYPFSSQNGGNPSSTELGNDTHHSSSQPNARSLTSGMAAIQCNLNATIGSKHESAGPHGGDSSSLWNGDNDDHNNELSGSEGEEEDNGTTERAIHPSPTPPHPSCLRSDDTDHDEGKDLPRNSYSSEHQSPQASINYHCENERLTPKTTSPEFSAAKCESSPALISTSSNAVRSLPTTSFIGLISSPFFSEDVTEFFSRGLSPLIKPTLPLPMIHQETITEVHRLSFCWVVYDFRMLRDHAYMAGD